MNFRQFLGVICVKNLRESGILSRPWGAPYIIKLKNELSNINMTLLSTVKYNITLLFCFLRFIR